MGMREPGSVATVASPVRHRTIECWNSERHTMEENARAGEDTDDEDEDDKDDVDIDDDDDAVAPEVGHTPRRAHITSHSGSCAAKRLRWRLVRATRDKSYSPRKASACSTKSAGSATNRDARPARWCGDNASDVDASGVAAEEEDKEARVRLLIFACS
jgi:hypothetical protein